VATMQPIPPFPFRRHHPAVITLFVLLFWILAAALVLTAQIGIEPRSPSAGAVAAVAALVLTSFGYTHFVARETGVVHALGVGIAWLALSMAAEIALTAVAGHPWLTLLGSPHQPLLRHILLFVWIFSPSFFARRAGSW
jgi:hypothetical protein